MNTIPFINLKHQTQAIEEAVLKDWKTSLQNCDFINGAHVQSLEAELAAKLQVKNVVACANGTDAILIALQAAGLKAGDHVAIPNLTFWATYEMVVHLGGIPVLVDIDSEHLQMSFDEFKEAHQRFKFKYAILVHLMGWAHPDLESMRKYCKENSIRLLEDGAQSFGVKINGRSVESGADVSTLSFYPAKVFGGCMDGGAILPSSDAEAQVVRSLINHGRSSHYSYQYVGWNSRMGSLQAAFLRRALPHVDQWIQGRLDLHSYYRDEIKSLERFGIRMFGPSAHVTPNGYLAVLASDSVPVSTLAEKLKLKGIATCQVYPETIHQQKIVINPLCVSKLERSRAFCEKVINLPLYFGLTMAEAKRVIHGLKEVLKS